MIASHCHGLVLSSVKKEIGQIEQDKKCYDRADSSKPLQNGVERFAVKVDRHDFDLAAAQEQIGIERDHPQHRHDGLFWKRSPDDEQGRREEDEEEFGQ